MRAYLGVVLSPDPTYERVGSGDETNVGEELRCLITNSNWRNSVNFVSKQLTMEYPGGLETSRVKTRYVERPARKRRYHERPSRYASYSTSVSLDQEISRDEEEAEDPVNVHVPALEQTVGQREEGSGEDDSTRHLCSEKCVTLVEKRRVRQFFRLCAVVNVLSLMASGPFQSCRSNMTNMRNNDTGYDCFPQYVTIACVDFVLSVLFTVQLVARLQYAWWYRKTAGKVSVLGEDCVQVYTPYSIYMELLVRIWFCYIYIYR